MSKKILIIKTSSLGDVVHTFPAVTDAMIADPNLHIDWVVEESFAAIVKLHPAINNIITLSWRKWRQKLWKKSTWQELKIFYQQLRARHYDLIIDAQGLVKSAIITKFACGKSFGLNFSSAREPLASLFYTKRFLVNRNQHAIERVRQLFSQILNYSYDAKKINYGVKINRKLLTDPYIILLHGTTWKTKNWPEIYWKELACLLANAGYKIRLLWGNSVEYTRALRIARVSPLIEVCPNSNLMMAIHLIAHAHAIVAVDTGFAQLAAALNVPAVILYGPTSPYLTGTKSENHTHLIAKFKCAPCLKRYCKIGDEKNSLFPPCLTEINPQSVFNLLTQEFACKLVS